MSRHLLPSDHASSAWLLVKAEAETIALDAMNMLERTGTPIEITEFARGQIAAVRRIMALAEPPEAPRERTHVDYV